MEVVQPHLEALDRAWLQAGPLLKSGTHSLEQMARTFPSNGAKFGCYFPTMGSPSRAQTHWFL